MIRKDTCAERYSLQCRHDADRDDYLYAMRSLETCRLQDFSANYDCGELTARAYGRSLNALVAHIAMHGCQALPSSIPSVVGSVINRPIKASVTFGLPFRVVIRLVPWNSVLSSQLMRLLSGLASL